MTGSSSPPVSDPHRPGSDEWSDCPPGEIHGMVTRRHRRETLRQVARGSLAGSLLLCVAFAGLFLTGIGGGWLPALPGMQNHYGGIACRDVKSNWESYAAGTLDSGTSGQIQEHLVRCERCRDHFGTGNRDDAVSQTDRSTVFGNTRTIAVSLLSTRGTAPARPLP